MSQLFKLNLTPFASLAALESLHPKNGSVLSKENLNACVISLCRNEFRDLMLKLETTKLGRTITFRMSDYKIHKRFAKDGKVTIDFGKQLKRLFLSNVAPNDLYTFLRILSGKEKTAEKLPSTKERLMSNKSHALQEISPLVIDNARNIQNKAAVDSTTPKRKLGDVDTSQEPQKKISRPLLNALCLTDEQKKVLSAVLSGCNVFFTGSAGTGKSFLLRRILSALPPQTTMATASTGIAATHIGGVTLHTFAGVGRGDASLEECIARASKATTAAAWRRCQHLVIDEISMIDGDFFAKLEKIARHVRRNDKPFGGIQLILSGDFCQLPPVAKGSQAEANRKFCFQSSAWRRCVHNVIELKLVHRQKDQRFVKILQAIRMGECSEEAAEMLTRTISHRVSDSRIVATKLSTHNVDVDHINQHYFDQLPGEVREFKAQDSSDSVASFLDSHCPVSRKVSLKVGSQVMLMKNTKLQHGLANGARGIITKFDKESGLPVVKFCSGLETIVTFEKWSIRGLGGQIITRQQIPLRLAWAMSIHKSQGLTLDSVELSLSRVFECGQAYVALSRASSLEGLRVLDFTPSAVRAHPDVLAFYRRLRLVDDALSIRRTSGRDDVSGSDDDDDD